MVGVRLGIRSIRAMFMRDKGIETASVEFLNLGRGCKNVSYLFARVQHALEITLVVVVASEFSALVSARLARVLQFSYL